MILTLFKVLKPHMGFVFSTQAFVLSDILIVVKYSQNMQVSYVYGDFISS